MKCVSLDMQAYSLYIIFLLNDRRKRSNTLFEVYLQLQISAVTISLTVTKKC